MDLDGARLVNAEVEGEIDDSAASLPVASVASYLQERLGQQAAAYLLGIRDSRQLGRYQKDGGPRPRAVVELRMREAYKLLRTIADEFNGDVARSWFVGTNSRLGYRTPSDFLRQARSADEFTELRDAAKRFIISGATVRDPMEDMDAVRAARQRPMAERLELALSWNLMASQLRSGMTNERGSG